MASQLNLRGVYVAAVTPFGRDGSVALDALEGLAHGFLDAGAAGIPGHALLPPIGHTK